jgi:starch-binding outer membrane protein, SusD/RagB family
MKMTSKNVIIRFVSVIIILLIGYSCSEDFFNPREGNLIEPKDHYMSYKDLENSFGGISTCLKEVVPKMIILDGLRSDMMDITANTGNDMSNLYYMRFDKNNPMLDVSGFYKTIVNVNEVLANISKVTERDPTFDEFTQKQYRASLIAMRSWAYFQLIRINGSAAYIADNLTEIPKDLSLQYIPKEAMIDTLINQLLPYVHTDHLTSEIGINFYPTTKAMVGELYLEKNDYANAVIYLKMAIESFDNSTMRYKVDATYSREAWMNIFLQGSVPEDAEIFGTILFSGTEGQINPLSVWMQPSNEYVVKPSSVIFSKFQSQKMKNRLKGDQYRGIGVSIDTLENSSSSYIKKYSLEDGIEGYSQDVPFMRCGDIHLLFAEALNRSGQSDLALILLNQGILSEKTRPKLYASWARNMGIRGRVYLESLTVPDSITDQNKIIETIEDYITDERSLELAFEGYRMFDLIRIAKRRGNPDYLADRIAAKYPVNMQEMARNFFKNESNWYIPINN